MNNIINREFCFRNVRKQRGSHNWFDIIMRTMAAGERRKLGLKPIKVEK